MDNIYNDTYCCERGIGEGNMRRAIVSFSPFSFPNGGALWSCQLADFCGTRVHAPITDLSTVDGIFGNYHFWDSPPEQSDYTIVGGPPFPHTKEVTEYMHLFSRPLLIMLHDVNDMAEKCKPFWIENEDVIDGFIVSNDETYHKRPSYVARKPYVRTRLPYHPTIWNLNLDGKDNNRVCVLGRITPDKGARQVAMLTDYGFKVYVMGQKVELEEYHEYYKRVESTGAIVVPNPTNKEKRDILKKCSFYCSFTYQVEDEVTVEYSCLEAMNYGCYPVVANWMTKYFELGGLYFNGVENTQDMASNLKQLINFKERDKELFEARVISNYNNVLHWFDRELDKIEDLVLTINRKKGWETR